MTETRVPILSRTELGRSPVAKAIALGGVLTGRAMAKEHEKVTTRISIISAINSITIFVVAHYFILVF